MTGPAEAQTEYVWGTVEDGIPEWTTSAIVDGRLVTVRHTEKTAQSAARQGYHYERKLIRRALGTSGFEFEVVPYEPQPLPPPTDEDLNAERHGGVMVGSLGEEGEWSIALGHIYPPDMAQAVTLQMRSRYDERFDAYDKGAVKHCYAVRYEAWGDADSDWAIYWERDDAPIASATLSSFPATLVSVDGRAW